MSQRRHAKEPIAGLAGLTVGDFWSWAYSDILSNRNRSIFAEFVVGAALGVLEAPRVEWDEADLSYGGKRIEVKSAAYVQAWSQKRASRIQFDIAEKLGWDAATNTTRAVPTRASDCFVFCLLDEKTRERADPLRIEAWLFFVAPTAVIGAAVGAQKTIGLARVKGLSAPTGFAGLRSCVDSALGATPTSAAD